MARQSGRQTVHYDDGGGSICAVDGETTTDPLAVYCGRCERFPAFNEAWLAARRAERAKTLS